MPEQRELPIWEELYNRQLQPQTVEEDADSIKNARSAQEDWIDSLILFSLKLIGLKLHHSPSCFTHLNLSKFDDPHIINSYEVKLIEKNISLTTKLKNTYFFLLIFKPEIIEFFKFGIVGVSGIFVDLLAVTLFKESLRLDVRLCSVLAFPFAVSSNYFLNSIWTFKGNQEITFQSYIKFFGVNIIGLGVRVWSIHLILMIIPKLGQKFYLPITFFGILVAFFINFLASKFLVFNKKN